ncbi:hypothetical protein C942_01926 [Photobacterium marinum]|uniref:Uncharacterized protein n=1 Tax=Photobacterium marinum TaxID=1056511 RepID=L8J7S4_9GAMM|nr:hypothetical protein C942_01926 [Photobacterium marinum]
MQTAPTISRELFASLSAGKPVAHAGNATLTNRSSTDNRMKTFN